MRLKEYQVGALDTLAAFLKRLSEANANAETARAFFATAPEGMRARLPALSDPVPEAWNAARSAGITASPDDWRPLSDGAGRSIPHLCLKLPTGGGKTLLAAHGVDRILVSHFRQTAGFVLWIVPSEAIYTQTRVQLVDRGHPIRQALDRASGGRVKILEKLDGFTAQDVAQKLCVLLLMLQAAGRENKETLKVFRDSGRYLSFFPQADDTPAQAKLLETAPNLERGDLGDTPLPGQGAGWIKQSLGNALRLIRPMIVLDEGHRAYSQIARETLAGLNPRFMLELSATPNRELSNVLVNVPGQALKDEEMIKLPIQLANARNMNWQATLQAALDRLNALDREARAFAAESGRYIRPIMLIRADLTGREQRDKAGNRVHSEDAFEYLTQKAGVPPEAIRRQTAEVKELKDDDLLSPYCGVRVVITKDALREGWDCPFAYVLAILSRTTASTALTQMIGRILRQPHAKRTGVEGLDTAHVFCADADVSEAVGSIKTGLEREGMGDLAGEIRAGGRKDGTDVEVRFRQQFRGRRVMVPRVLHTDADKGGFRDLDYEADILACVDFEQLAWREADSFVLAAYDVAQHETSSIDIANGSGFHVRATPAVAEVAVGQKLDRSGLIRRMLDVVPNPWQGARILDRALAALRQRASEPEIVAARLTLAEAVNSDLRKQVETATEQIFRDKVKAGTIVFKLLAMPLDGLNHEFVECFTTHVANGDAGLPLWHVGGKAIERALYDRVFKKDFNEFEANAALYLDGRDAVSWWWRMVARRDWGLQGWMKHKVYPDFLVRVEADEQTARLLVLETKGKHLEGSDDTDFKRRFFEILEAAYTQGREAGEVELFADAPQAMRFRILIDEGAWKSELEGALGASAQAA